MALYDLNKHVYRNDSIYRFRSNILILDEEYEDEEENGIYALTSAFENEKNIDITVFTMTSHDSNEVSFKCEGKCECFVEDDANERKISSLVYSSRYVSLVVVSVLGFATARFIDQHIDTCYEKARDVLLGGRDVDKRLSCSMEEDDVDCKFEEEATEEEEIDIPEQFSHIRKIFKCMGHCNDRQKYKDIPDRLIDYAKAAIKDMDCEKKIGREEIVIVFESDSYRGNVELFAENRYRSQYLRAYCNSVKEIFGYVHPNGVRKQTYSVQPCQAHSFDPTMRNIWCKKVGFQEYIDLYSDCF